MDVIRRCPNRLAFGILPQRCVAGTGDGIALTVIINDDFGQTSLSRSLQVLHAEKTAFPVGLLTQLGSIVWTSENTATIFYGCCPPIGTILGDSLSHDDPSRFRRFSAGIGKQLPPLLQYL